MGGNRFWPSSHCHHEEKRVSCREGVDTNYVVSQIKEAAKFEPIITTRVKAREARGAGVGGEYVP